MDLVVSRDRDVWRAGFGAKVWRCAIGRGGVTRAKREGDGATPLGCWVMRRVLFRPDRVAAPMTALPISPLLPTDGWCDDSDDPRYNQHVILPTGGRHEKLWRDDRLYDVIVILGHNDSPPVAGRGSAIFLHIAKVDFAPTEGCVALALPDLQSVLAEADAASRVCIEAGGHRGAT